jgi:hypothetical protein
MASEGAVAIIAGIVAGSIAFDRLRHRLCHDA